MRAKYGDKIIEILRMRHDRAVNKMLVSDKRSAAAQAGEIQHSAVAAASALGQHARIKDGYDYHATSPAAKLKQQVAVRIRYCL